MIKHSSTFFWQASNVFIASFVLLPVITLIWLGFFEQQEQVLTIWTHLKSTVLNDYITHSLILVLGVCCTTLCIGIGSAWIVTQYQFFGRRWINWALLLPMAVPSYILAYSYTGLLDAPGAVQTWIRSSFDLQYGEYWFPQIRSLGGAIFVISFVLYPYVYLLARASFIGQGSHFRQTSQLLGYSSRQTFFKITLPIARPAIIAGLALVMMETLADFGTVAYFGVDTFTTGILRTWHGLGSLHGAAQLSLILLGVIFIVLAIENYFQSRKNYNSEKKELCEGKPITGVKAWIAFIATCLPICIGFIIPALQLINWSIATYEQLFHSAFWKLVEHTFILGFIASISIVLLGVLLAYGIRTMQNHLNRGLRNIASLGYAIPGIVIAVGVHSPITTIDNQIDTWSREYFSYSTGLILSGSIAILLIAYITRFLSVSLRSIDSGLTSINQNMDRASRSLGLSPLQTLRRVHFPMLRISLLTSLLIVFVDVIKELPATLILRPFNYNTLAVKAYELASDERLAEAALPSISIVLVGIIPIILLSRAIATR